MLKACSDCQYSDNSEGTYLIKCTYHKCWCEPTAKCDSFKQKIQETDSTCKKGKQDET